MAKICHSRFRSPAEPNCSSYSYGAKRSVDFRLACSCLTSEMRFSENIPVRARKQNYRLVPLTTLTFELQSEARQGSTAESTRIVEDRPLSSDHIAVTET